ncbi:hypothetical protein NYA22BAC_03270 [Parasphingorhabdus sp. NYA22]|jgi:hypothetical protein
MAASRNSVSLGNDDNWGAFRTENRWAAIGMAVLLSARYRADNLSTKHLGSVSAPQYRKFQKELFEEREI